MRLSLSSLLTAVGLNWLSGIMLTHLTHTSSSRSRSRSPPRRSQRSPSPAARRVSRSPPARRGSRSPSPEARSSSAARQGGKNIDTVGLIYIGNAIIYNSVLQANPTKTNIIGAFGLSLYTDDGKLDEVFGRYGRITKIVIIKDGQVSMLSLCSKHLHSHRRVDLADSLLFTLKMPTMLSAPRFDKNDV